MRRIWAVTLAVTVAALVAALPLAMTARPAYGQAGKLFDRKTMMRTSELRPGMRGVGKSVFQGVEPTTFNVEILGVLEKDNLGGDVVLIKVLDGPVVERQTGIIAGMSGSPVYVHGRLVGAIAFTWGFEREPIGGVTPIEDMLEALESRARVKEPPSSAAKPTGAVVHGRRVTGAAILGLDVDPELKFVDADTLALRPVGTYLACNGFSPRALQYVRERLRGYGIIAETGPGPLPKERRVPVDLQPGSALGVALIDGDFSAAATGTVTYRQGDVLLAFGHPFSQSGTVDLPLYTAWVHDIMPSYQRSVKLSSIMDPVGRLDQDRAWSIAGITGAQAERIPVHISVNDRTRDWTREFNVGVAQHEDLSPIFILSSIFDALDAAYKPTGKGTSRVSLTVTTKSGLTVKREDTFYSSMSVADTAVSDLATAVVLLTDNPYDPQHIAKVDVSVELSEQNRSARIEDVYAEEAFAKAGEDLHLHVVLKPQQGEQVEQVVTLKMPLDVKKGVMRVGVTGGSATLMKMRLGIPPPLLDSLPDLVKDFQESEPNNRLVVAAGLPNAGLTLDSVRLARLPSSIASIMSSSVSSRLRVGREELSASADTDYIVLGERMLTIAVQDKFGEKAAVPRRPGQPPTPPLPSPGPLPPMPPEGDFDLGLGMCASWAPAGLRPTWRVLTGEQWPLPSAAQPAAADEPWEITDEPAAPAPKAEKPAQKPGEPVAKEGEKEGEKKPAEQPPAAVTRQPSQWLQTKADDFLAGEAEGVAIVNVGDIELAPKPERLEKTKQFCLWSAAVDDKGNAYFGSGNDGTIYRVAEGKVSTFCETGQVGVHCLLPDGKGNLIAGTSAAGKVLRINAEGKSEVLYTAEDQYVWSLALHGADLYAGTGYGGKVIKISADGSAQVFAELPAAHVLCLAFSGDTLYAGTSEDGVLYKIDAAGKAEAVYESSDDCISALAVGPDGTVYVGTAGEGKIVKLAPNTPPKVLYDSPERAINCLLMTDSSLYAGTGDKGRLLHLVDAEPEPRAAVVADLDPQQVLSLAKLPDGSLLAGTGNMGEVFKLPASGQAEGVFESDVFDAQRLASWGMISWQATVPEGAALEVQTRSGSTSDPDQTWSSWSGVYSKATGELVTSPPARFIQYRAKLIRRNQAQPIVHSVKLAYLGENQKPTVELQKPQEGSALSKEQELTWKAEDPDKDTLTHSVYASHDGGATWETLKADLEEPKFKWDTTKATEGVYQLKIVVSDQRSNPVDAKQAEVVVGGIVVDNTPPKLYNLEKGELTPEKTVTIKGLASDALTAITAVEYRIGEKGKYQAVPAADKVYDTGAESFALTTVPLEPGEQTIEVRASDAAGNWATEKFKVTVPGQQKPEEGAKEGEKPSGPSEGPKPAEGGEASAPAKQ